MPSRRPATAFATSQRTISPAPPADEVADPRPYAEILRQWSSVHPEFSFLPRKFKIAVTGAERDRAAIQVHDIGLHLKKNDDGETRLCRLCRRRAGPHADDRQEDPRFLPEEISCPTRRPILRVYNLYGRRDNKYKARIKILVHEPAPRNWRVRIEAEFEKLQAIPS
jgi:sulfite reductase (NADPH) hemoprotein beta-component